ncbi:isoliquiritigenin 2'-O-methyltransferase-like [Arachis stenosperma]|uniref:isoliquiritigenin 2'-O-methyltransferase-like n=1 Tax=Arachis stenosperma TaxID=217475 RepID=UPI0025AD324A|nr:isoliquiritigenin 2'-O-methyltransferase-like [Arachis stenosperma]
MSSTTNNNNNNNSKEEYDDAFTKAASFAFAQVFPAILNAAIDMNLFDIISKAESSLGMSASEIASKIPNQHSEMGSRLERMLPSLVARSLLTCSIRTINEDGDTERIYAVSPVGKYYTSTHHDEQGGSWIVMSTITYQGCRHIWTDTKDAILDANNHNHFQKVYGKMAFEYMETDTELGNLFGQAMSQAGSLGMKQVLNAYKGFEGVSTLVDVGGGYGQTLKQIIFQYPSIKAINFDLPHVVKNAPPHPGIEHIGGDMFKTVPKADAILLKHVCHNWGDEECVKFLRNCYEALPPHGKVIVLDALLPEIPKSTSFKDTQAVDLDFLMFLVHGGKERTEKQFEKLCKASGFSRFQVACNDSSNVVAVMEFYK